MPFINVAPRLQLHYLEKNPAGTSTVLLLHGLGADSSSWQLQIPALTQAGFRVLAPDAPGFGQSTYDGGGASIQRVAALISKFLDATQAGSVHLVGISMGGTIALQMALDFPQTTSKLVLINTFAKLRLSSPKAWPYFALRFILVHTLGIPTQARSVARRIFPHPEQGELRRLLIAQIVQADPRAYRASMRALARFDVADRLQEIHRPTLVVTGDADTTVAPANQEELVKKIAGARQSVVPKAGHAVTIEQPERFNQVLLDFLLSV
jgi:pimeloyl-ACP methyl ester carboxylesterase